MAEGLEVDAGIGQGQLRIAGAPELCGDIGEAGHARGERARVLAEAVDRARPRDAGLDAHGIEAERGAVMHDDLASEQVERLDAVGAFVDRIQAVVAVELFDLVFARVAVAAMNLDGQVVGGQAPLRRPALGDRGQDVEQQVEIGERGRVGADFGLVDQARAVEVEGEATLDVGLLRKQHAAHVGVVDDLRLRAGRVLALGAERPSLRAIARIVERMQVTGIAERDGAEADADARVVHHVEHAGQALVQAADQVADRAGAAFGLVTPAFAEIEQAVDRAAVAHLVVDPGQLDVVALAEAAVLVDEELRHQQQRDAAHAGDQLAVRAGHLGQDQVHDVLGKLVVATRDPHLVAGHAEARTERGIAVRFGARGDVRQRGAGLRFGQAHRAEEAAGQLGLDEGPDLGRTGMCEQQLGIAVGQHRIGRGADIGRVQIGRRRDLDDLRQLHAAAFVVLGGAHQAGRGQRRERRADFVDDLHALAVEARFVAIGFLVVRSELFLGQARGRVEHRVEGLATVIGKARGRRQRRHVEPFMEQEFEIPAREQQLGHCLREPRTGRPRPGRRRCTWSPRHASRRVACLRSGHGRPGAHR